MFFREAIPKPLIREEATRSRATTIHRRRGQAGVIPVPVPRTSTSSAWRGILHGRPHRSTIPVPLPGAGSARPAVISLLQDHKDLERVVRERIAHRPTVAIRFDEAVGSEPLQVPGGCGTGYAGIVGYLRLRDAGVVEKQGEDLVAGSVPEVAADDPSGRIVAPSEVAHPAVLVYDADEAGLPEAGEVVAGRPAVDPRSTGDLHGRDPGVVPDAGVDPGPLLMV